MLPRESTHSTPWLVVKTSKQITVQFCIILTKSPARWMEYLFNDGQVFLGVRERIEGGSNLHKDGSRRDTMKTENSDGLQSPRRLEIGLSLLLETLKVRRRKEKIPPLHNKRSCVEEQVKGMKRKANPTKTRASNLAL